MNTKAKGKKPKRAPRKPKQWPAGAGVRFFEGVGPRMEPIIPEPAAREGAERAVDVLAKLIEEQNISAPPDSLEERLGNISEDYWHNRRWYERITLIDVKNTIKPMQKSNNRLIKLLSERPNYLNFIRLGERSILSPVKKEPSDLEVLREKLKQLSGVWKELSKLRGQASRRKEAHIQNAVDQLATLWSEVTGEEVARSYRPDPEDPGPGGRDKFKAVGPRSVQFLMQAIDPEATFAQIRTALERPKD
jgi:hypothetical protein